ncbi:MAG: fibronectin type III domain-containing protein [Victivallales bacterium]
MKRLKVLLGMLFVLVIALTAQARLERVGPVGANGYPAWYQDTTGLILEFGTPLNQAELDGGWCLILPADVPNGTAPETFPANFAEEHFYWAGDASIDFVVPGGVASSAILVLGLEGAFGLGPVAAGDQVTFGRVRVRINDLPYDGTYKVYTPFKDFTFENQVAGDRLFFTEDIGLASPFDGALLSSLGPFLLPSLTPGGPELAPIAGPVPGKLYIADPGRIGPVTGSPLPPFSSISGPRNHNIFRIEGPNGFVIETTDFALVGRLYNGPVTGNVIIDRASYTRTVNDLKVDVFATGFPATQSRLPGSPIPPAMPPVLNFFNAPPTVDPATGALGAPVGQTPIPMLSSGISYWGQSQPAFIPLGVTVEDSSGPVPVYYGANVTDDVLITLANYDPTGTILTVNALSSDSVLLPTLNLSGFGDLLNGTITVPTLNAPPAFVNVLSSAGGLTRMAVSTGVGIGGGGGVPGATVPDAPTGAAATAGNLQATVSFSPPAIDGGSPVTSYTVTSSPGGRTATGSASPLTVTGLLNGTTYTFTVRATNLVGTGLASSPSNAVVPLGVPFAPTGVTAVAGNAQATVRFFPPLSNGSPAVTSYTVTSTPGGIVKTGVSSPVVVTGLTNGTSYTFTVAASNINGTGTPSTASNAVTPASLPGAPIGVTALAGNTQATVSFTPPVSDGGIPISLYTVISNPGGISVTGTPSPLTVTGLTNGTSYTFVVSATNALGTGPASASSAAIRPATLPDAPTITAATPGIQSATIAFAAPFNGGSPITSYTVTSNPGGLSISGASSPLTVTGLTYNTLYNFTVKAANAIGTGPSSIASAIITPTATAPGAPTAVTAVRGDKQATVSFNPPLSNGGTAITGYIVTSTVGVFSASGTASPLTVTGLTNGTAYRFTVKATNAAGTSVASVASAAVTPATAPNSPVITSVTAGQRQVTVAFTPPANGGSAITGYTVTSNPGGISAARTASPITVTGLTYGVPYTFTVTASNSVGTSASSAASNTIAPSGVLPSTPRTVTAVRGNTQATVSFLPPTADGGAAVTGYTVTSSPGGLTATGAASPLTVTGLTNGTAYRFSVKATTNVGTGPASALSAAVTPATVPDAPTIGTATAGVGRATVTFTPPASNGGSAIIRYTSTASPGGITATSTVSPITVLGLSPGTAYTFTVNATNAVGSGASSVSSNQIVP